MPFDQGFDSSFPIVAYTGKLRPAERGSFIQHSCPNKVQWL